MLSFFTITSFLYCVTWAILQPRLIAHIRSFDPKRGTLKEDGKVYYHPQSHEGRFLIAFVYGTMLQVGGYITLGFRMLIGLIWGF